MHHLYVTSQRLKQHLETVFGLTRTASIKPNLVEHKLLPSNYPELVGVFLLFTLSYVRFVTAKKSWDFLQIILACNLQGEHRSHIWEFYNAVTNRAGIFFPPLLLSYTIV